MLLKDVHRKANLLFLELYPDTEHEFKASKCWFTSICPRNNLFNNRITSPGEKCLKIGAEIEIEILHDRKNIGEFANLENMDKTPCYFNIPGSSTIDKKGVQTVKVKTADLERLFFTIAEAKVSCFWPPSATGIQKFREGSSR